MLVFPPAIITVCLLIGLCTIVSLGRFLIRWTLYRTLFLDDQMYLIAMVVTLACISITLGHCKAEFEQQVSDHEQLYAVYEQPYATIPRLLCETPDGYYAFNQQILSLFGVAAYELTFLTSYVPLLWLFRTFRKIWIILTACVFLSMWSSIIWLTAFWLSTLSVYDDPFKGIYWSEGTSFGNFNLPKLVDFMGSMGTIHAIIQVMVFFLPHLVLRSVILKRSIRVGWRVIMIVVSCMSIVKILLIWILGDTSPLFDMYDLAFLGIVACVPAYYPLLDSVNRSRILKALASKFTRTEAEMTRSRSQRSHHDLSSSFQLLSLTLPSGPLLSAEDQARISRVGGTEDV